MKKRSFISILGLSLITGVAFVLSVTAASSAWFSRFASHEPGWKSGSDGAYFAYGNGKIENAQQKDRPYGITRPLHLYNLAWLQYLGFFDKDTIDDAYTKDNVYFELANDLDMTGWVLPPIGTKDKPFIGNFNGNGYKITNLTVSNNFDSYNRTPYGILNNLTKEQFKNNVNILGLFGVVGDYNGAVGGTYSTSANEIINTGISNLTVASSSTTSLVGLAAGYVNGSIEGVAVNDSYIDMRNSGGQAITSITNNISDYSLIGYAASQDYLAKLQSSTTVYDSPTVSNPFVSQGGDEWGASIEMKKMYNTLHAKMEAADRYTPTYTTLENQERDYLGDGEFSPSSGFTPIPADTETATYRGYDTYTSNSYTHYLYHLKDTDTGTKKDGTSVQTASYSFISDVTNNSWNVTSDPYVGLSGNKERSYTYTQRSTTNYSMFTIRDSISNKYLVLNYTSSWWSGDTVSVNSSDSSTNGSFGYDEDNYIFTIYDGTIYYLNASGTSLTFDTSPSTTWTWDSTNSAFKTGNYYLVYYNGSWTLRNNLNLEEASCITIKDRNANRYLAVNNGNLTVVSSSNSAGKCLLVNNYVTILYNNTFYYILLSNNSLSLTAQQTNACVRIYSNYLYSNGTYIFMTATGNNGFTYSQSTNNQRRVTQNNSTYVPSGSHATTKISNGTTSSLYSDGNETRYLYTPETYFPLTWEDDSAINPSDKNTGYVISGHEFSNITNGVDRSIGDVRVASYYTTSMLDHSFTSGSSYDNNRLFAYTYNSSGNLVKIGDNINGMINSQGYTSYETLGLKKYYYQLLGRTTGSRVGLGNMLGASGENPAYGLHFMNATISKNNLINVPYTKINGYEYTNYDLPRDAIDFNLKADGFINFFAATYFVNTSNNNTNWNNSNNSFFSLHSIDRNDPNESNPSSNTIDSIRQIAKIYKNTEYTEVNNDVPQYVYTYRDSNDNEVTSYWDTGVRNENNVLITGTQGDLVFDTYWLTDPEYDKFDLRALYYFEIPVNKGEFALGSTSGYTKTSRSWPNAYNKNGAYLLYLDIGAGVKNSTAVTINEKSTTTTYKYNYPRGVDFAVVSSSTTGSYTGILGGETSAIVVPSSNQANTKYVYTPKSNNADATLVVGPTSGGGGYTATYKTVDTVVKDTTNATVGIVSASSSVDVMEREIMYDLTTNTNNYTVTTQHTIDGVRGAVTTVTTTETWTEQEIMTIANFDVEGIGLFTVVYSSTLDSTGSNAISIESTYNPLTHAYVINFVSSEANKTVDIMFTSINLSQSYTEDGVTTNLSYTLSVANNGVDTGVALGNITSANLNKAYSLVCGLAS